MSFSRKTITIISVTVISILLIGYLMVAISFSGGIGGLISNLKPAPDTASRDFIAKRSSAKSSLSDTFSGLEAATGLKSYATSSYDHCFEGQNNWKITDGYAHRCVYRISNFYGFSGDFREKIISLEEQFLARGWIAQGNSVRPLKEIMQEYYDEYYGPGNPKPLNFPDEYLVSDLPTPTSGYTKDGMRLEIEYAERSTGELNQLKHAQNTSRGTFFDTYQNKEFQNIESVFDEITASHEYVLAISIEQKYFQN